MKKPVICGVLFGLFAATAQGYSIKHSYSGQNKSTDYYGACENGKNMKITQHADGRFSYEGPAGNGLVARPGSLDKAAAAACGE